jgi:hypothetical protein
MTGLVRKAAALAACGVFFGAAVAFAGVPSPANSTIPARINLVGYEVGSGLADGAAAGATVTVTVRDLANNPIPNSSVVLDFSGCVSDTRIDDSQAYFPGLTANCGAHSVSSLTDGAGVATFVVVGGGLASVSPAHAVGAGKVWADGVLLGNMGVGTYDENGAGGVGGADLSRFLGDFVGGTNPDRSDFNGAAGVGGADLSLWLATFVAGQSNTSSGSYCL